MRSHLHLVGWLHVVWGAMGLLLGAASLLLAAGAASIAIDDRVSAMAAAFTTVMFLVFTVALVLGGWANVWAGRAVRRHQSGGRTAALVLAVVNLFVLPFGTALAVYAFWVLLHNDSRILFEAHAAH
ncbi:MAG TPA: hypothetical protein VFK20_16450 [Vicinamibacterales bacterium]|nr:hypothetical protein [Vicinamibacterales bacterium]